VRGVQRLTPEPVVRPVIKETTAVGAAYAAGLAVGYFQDLDDLCANWSVDKTWNPQMEESKRASMYQSWKKAVTRTFGWIEEPAAEPEKTRVITAN